MERRRVPRLFRSCRASDAATAEFTHLHHERTESACRMRLARVRSPVAMSIYAIFGGLSGSFFLLRGEKLAQI